MVCVSFMLYYVLEFENDPFLRNIDTIEKPYGEWRTPVWLRSFQTIQPFANLYPNIIDN